MYNVASSLQLAHHSLKKIIMLNTTENVEEVKFEGGLCCFSFSIYANIFSRVWNFIIVKLWPEMMPKTWVSWNFLTT